MADGFANSPLVLTDSQDCSQTQPTESWLEMQGVLSGDICVADGPLHPLHGSLCHLWIRHWPQDVHQEQLGCPGMHLLMFVQLHFSHSIGHFITTIYDHCQRESSMTSLCAALHAVKLPIDTDMTQIDKVHMLQIMLYWLWGNVLLLAACLSGVCAARCTL